jgi:hypothetical protein
VLIVQVKKGLIFPCLVVRFFTTEIILRLLVFQTGSYDDARAD